MIKIARTRFNNNPDVNFSVARAESIPFPDKSFNIVIAAGLFEYFDELNTSFKEVYRVLCSKGSFVATFPYLWSLPRIWDRVVILPIAKLIRLVHKRKEKIDSREFSEQQVIKLLKENGFRIEKTVFYNSRFLWTPFNRLFPKLSVMLSKFFESLTPKFFKTGFIIKAIKIN